MVRRVSRAPGCSGVSTVALPPLALHDGGTKQPLYLPPYLRMRRLEKVVPGEEERTGFREV